MSGHKHGARCHDHNGYLDCEGRDIAAHVGASADRSALAIVTDWLDDDEALRIPDTEWGRSLYAAIRSLIGAKA